MKTYLLKMAGKKVFILQMLFVFQVIDRVDIKEVSKLLERPVTAPFLQELHSWKPKPTSRHR